ncbi:host-nuclease inhibitor Gam family protein [Lentilactobacillus senioris]|uniref:host-nuclease inhibitor Gam family protein n=1 Tax=Lentilactobacillus senioris TaxID=931534 RepID=UPI002281B5F5|nr:host-nuclease inhibitor Gam family protein [Lentilactobacillus senioris]MCY9806536.1 host-nuclease inhibitor Gam family protein [Lentilactobacillus senioris]
MDEVKERFFLKNDDEADWAFEKLAGYKRQSKQLENQREKFAKKYQKRIDDWYNPQNTSIQDQISYFQGLIEEYRLTKPDGKVNVPSGKTSVRTTKKFIKDENVLLAYVESNHPEFIESNPKVKWGEFKRTLKPVNGKAVDENGEIVEGITTQEETKVTYKPNMEAIGLSESEEE